MINNKKNAFLHNTINFPPVDNQGAIRCCVSQALTYIQFTNAVSRKINSDSWQPYISKSACFSPRFTHLLCSGSPIKIYDFIKDHGCLDQHTFPFAKDSGGGSIELKNNIPIKNSVSWKVDKSSFKNALKYRLKKYHKLSIETTPPSELINEIKKSINDGNVVISTTSLENWIVSELSKDCGKIGKKGDAVVIASRRYIPSGHSFAIVGYDDDITIDFAGNTFQGAFLITCSYGEVWQNKGFVWMLYDAIYPVSKFHKMNNKDIYGGKTYLTSYYEKIRIFAHHHITNPLKEIQDFTFNPIKQIQIEDMLITAYNIQDSISKKYLCYENHTNPEFPTFLFKNSNEANSLWCIVPYKKLKKWKSFNAEYNPFYENSYWIFSADLYLQNSNSRCFLDNGLNFYDIGRIVGLSRFNNGNYPQAKSWILENFSDKKYFNTQIGICSENEKIITHRTYTLKDFWFLDWDDVVIGLPQLMVNIEIQTIDRESFKINLLRYDKNGDRNTYTPAIFRTKHAKYVTNNDYMSFSGEINTLTPETGFFTFQYGDLLELETNKTIEDYIWGLEIISVNQHKVIINQVSLMDQNESVLYDHDFSNTPKILSNEAIEILFNDSQITKRI